MYKTGAVSPHDVAAYVAAYARDGRMGAAFDYCRRIVDDMEFNKKQFKCKLPMRLLAVGGQYSIPTMGESLQPNFQNVTSIARCSCCASRCRLCLSSVKRPMDSGGSV